MALKQLGTTCRGKSFIFLANDAEEASTYTFMDEADVREELWDIHPGDIVLDIGCAYGSYTLSALAMGAAMVHCWTPLANEHRLLTRSLAANGWLDKAHQYEFGLYDKTGWLVAETQAFSVDRPASVPQNHVVFEVERLDAVYERAKDRFPDGHRYVMKLDTEAAEPEILRGGEAFIKKFRPVIKLEDHVQYRPGVEKICEDYLATMGYKLRIRRPFSAWFHSVYDP